MAWWKKSQSALHVTSPASRLEDEKKFPRVSFEETGWDAETLEACKLLRQAVGLRKKYDDLNTYPASTWVADSQDPFAPPAVTTQLQAEIKSVAGVWRVLVNGKENIALPAVKEFAEDYVKLTGITANGAVKTLTYKRLKALKLKYEYHMLLNQQREASESQRDPKDFSNVMKVDTHIHLSAAMTSKHLLDFIKAKVSHHPDDVVNVLPDGTKVTLRGVFDKLALNPDTFTLNMLDTRADNTFERFDHFNAKYNPFGKSELRDVFLKTENKMNGRYFAELTRECIERLEKSKYTSAEFRLSIYGTKRNEWDTLAAWVKTYKLYSTNMRWMVQLPRIFYVFKKVGTVKNFQELLDNIFVPLFEVTNDPTSHPDLHVFLNHVSGIDSVDDESRPEKKFDETLATVAPADWNSGDNPPYAYYMYYIWANLASLNKLRAAKGLRTLDFRPHCGESGDIDHLAAAYLTAKHINHGINLSKTTPLQYLYYCSQIGLAVSPLSNNSLFLDYHSNPFPRFFQRGLNVSLSTDDPLQFHYTEQPLMEEYAICSQKWKLGDIELSEIARNSVLQSGFEHNFKVQWLGEKYALPGPAGNDITRSNLPLSRVSYRYDTWQEELSFIDKWGTMTTLPPSIVSDSYFKDYEQLTSMQTSLSATDRKHSKPAATNLLEAVKLIQTYSLNTGAPDRALGDSCPATHHGFSNVLGVYTVFEGAVINGKQFLAVDPMNKVPSLDDFLHHCNDLAKILENAATGSFAYNRLKILESKYEFHTLLNGKREKEIMKTFTTDYAHVNKVDNSVRLASGMLAKHLLRFIREKIANEGDVVVLVSDDEQKQATLHQIFELMEIPLAYFTLDALDVKATTHFKSDSFRAKYNPFGHSELRSLFLETTNYVKGRFFAELSNELLRKRERNDQIIHEYRLTILGASRNEWDLLAKWILNHNVASAQVMWAIELPMAYSIYKKQGHVKTFQDVLDNIFIPLFEVTRDPSTHPELYKVLSLISGLDCAFEKLSSVSSIDDIVPPQAWVSESDPTPAYVLYYLWANLNNLNHFRLSKSQAALRLCSSSHTKPSAQQQAAIILTSQSISQGEFLLSNTPTLTYLFYLSQKPVIMSPLYANCMGLSYQDHPFPRYFKRGLCVTLSTHTPLQLHSTSDPLMEEYAIAMQMWRLTDCDVSEISRNSVLSSGLPHKSKQNFLGPNYLNGAVKGNDSSKTNVPTMRLHYRETTLQKEIKALSALASGN